MKGKITNREYQSLNDVSNRKATNELSALVREFTILEKAGAGAGTFYHLQITQKSRKSRKNHANHAINEENESY